MDSYAIIHVHSRTLFGIAVNRHFYRSGAGARSLTEVVAAGIKKLELVERGPQDGAWLVACVERAEAQLASIRFDRP